MRLTLSLVLLGAIGSAGVQATDVQGFASGLTTSTVVCRNLTSGRTVQSAGNLKTWSCSDLGLSVAAGDRVMTGVKGLLPLSGSLGLAGPAGAVVDFVSHTVSDQEIFGFPVAVGDLDGDGDPDVVPTVRFAWYENLGAPAPNLLRHPVESPETIALEARLLDVNLDGRLDIVAAFGGNSDQLVWFQNRGGTPLEFVLRPIDQRDGWTIHDLDAGDLDGDGDLDFVAEMAGGSFGPEGGHPPEDIVWVENVGGGAFTRHTLASSNTGSASSILAVDADEDGDVDVVLSNTATLTVSWFENDGEGDPGFTIQHLIDAFNAQEILGGDVDRDGDMDIVTSVSLTDGGEMRWYEQLGGGLFQVRTVGVFPNDDFPAAIGDFSADGRLDIALVGFLSWLENEGGSPPTFTKHDVEGTAFAFDITPVDVDLDGRLDLMGTEIGVLVWQENMIGLRLSVTGMSVRQVMCRNVTTHQTIRVQTSETTVDCDQLGLVVNPGDEIAVQARGLAE